MAVLICSGILPFAVFADRSTSVYYVNETGGIITAVGCEGGAGIGGGLSAPGGTVVINAGTVTAEAGTYAQAIGHGFDEAYWNGDTDEQLVPGTITLATDLAVSYGDEL